MRRSSSRFEKPDAIAAGDAMFDHVTAARDRLLERMARNGLFWDRP